MCFEFFWPILWVKESSLLICMWLSHNNDLLSWLRLSSHPEGEKFKRILIIANQHIKVMAELCIFPGDI